MRFAVLCAVALAACATAEPEPVPAWSKTAELSDGQCPDLSVSSMSTFSSGGLEREVWVALPADMEPNLPVVFVWHGLGTPDQEPARSTYRGWGLEQLALDSNAIVLAPQARTLSWPLIGDLSLWGILHDEEPDLVLYDDLRTCLAQTHDVDLSRVTTWGHSGGALWTTALVVNRSETLAAYAQYSGGANLEMPMPDSPFLWWWEHEHTPPGLYVSGGVTDKWPSEELLIIDFEATTGQAAQLAHDSGHEVVRCHHNMGHNQIPTDMRALGMQWMFEHRWGEPSPMLERQLPDGCLVGPDPQTQD